MVVLHIDTGMSWRGGQRQVLTLHEGLLLNGIDSHLLCQIDGELNKIASEKQLKNIIPFKPKKGFFNLLNNTKTRKIIDQIGPDILHSHDSHSLMIAVKKKKNRILFNTRRVSYPINILSHFFKYKYVDCHVAVSEEIQEYLIKKYRETYVINSCVDLKRFSNPKKLNFFKKSSINLLYVGAFTSQKGINILILAMQKLAKANNSLKLHLVGDGELLNWAKEYSIELGIKDRTIFYGAVNNIEDYYFSSDFVVCPSVSGEGSSGVIKEALAANKTIIASDLKCNREIITENKDGYLFKNKDFNDLAEVVLSCIKGERALDPRNIQNKVKTFSCNYMIEKYKSLYFKMSQSKL